MKENITVDKIRNSKCSWSRKITWADEQHSVLTGNLDFNFSGKTFVFKLIFVWADLLAGGNSGLDLTVDERKTVALLRTSVGDPCEEAEFDLVFPAGLEVVSLLAWSFLSTFPATFFCEDGFSFSDGFK